MELGAENTKSNLIRQLVANVRSKFQARFHYWLNRRIPPVRQLVLGHHNIFIIPNKQGLAFSLVLMLMFVGAVNYESNLAFALVFLLISKFLLTILYTFKNLSGLHIAAVSGSAVFAGEAAEITVILNRYGTRTYENIQLSFPHSRTQNCDLVESHEQRVSLFVPASQRGKLNPGRLVVETIFPFGICRAWSLIDFKLNCLVYPKPIECDLDWLLSNQLHDGKTALVRGGDDFHGLREYQLGDPLKHVAWKNFARGQGMLIKEYARNMDQRVWLRWEMFPDLDAESRLSRLCWCVIKLDESGLDFGLEIPGVTIQPAKGPAHYLRALEALACFGLSGERQ